MKDKFFDRPLYFDTNVFIYVFEGVEKYQSLAGDFFNVLKGRNHQIVTSTLTIVECLVKPKKDKNQDLENVYMQAILFNSYVQCQQISTEILIKSSEIRADYQVKLFDTIHIATAIQSGCSSIVTNDRQFKSIQEVGVLYLDDFLN